jgi:hypothetical protein
MLKMKGRREDMELATLGGEGASDLVIYDPHKDRELDFLPPELREHYRESLRHNHNLLTRLAKM